MKHQVISLLLMFSAFCANAQLAVKTNILYDATTTPNIGAEFRLGPRSTVNLVYGLNAWKFDSKTHGERYGKHWVVMPEYRWWPCLPFNGHFIGAHLFGGEMNAAHLNLPIPGVFFSGDNLTQSVKEHRIEGEFIGAGFTYGYQYAISKHWNIEAEIGIGYDHVWYDHYPCYECGAKISSGHSNYAGVTKLGLSVLYIF